jgi:hypothetical protein
MKPSFKLSRCRKEIPMKKPIVTSLLAVCLSALPLAGVASAQQPGGNFQNQAQQAAGDVANKASGSNWGWLGLIGLAGLIGLRGRHAHESTPRQPFRREEPVASR